MFVYSVRSSKLKFIALLLVVALAVCALLYFSGGGKPAVQDGGISLRAGNAAERTAFLSQFGWEIDEEPAEVCEVIIPAEFDSAYQSYNELQKRQNLDLTDYHGLRAKRWTYEVKNYPGYESRSGTIQANLLVLDGAVIGGDICSLAPNGFMQGFDMPQGAEKSAPENTSEADGV